MIEIEKVSKLVNYIEENLRTTKTSGLEFIDPRHLTDRLVSKQNHVVFGRRGAGKSTLLSSVTKDQKSFKIFLNMDDFKDITFPNIILHILIASFSELEKHLKKSFPWYKFKRKARKLKKILLNDISQLEQLTSQPDFDNQQIREKQLSEDSVGFSMDANTAKAEYKTTGSREKEVTKQNPVDKLNYLRLNLSKFKSLFEEISSLCENQIIFLVLDDFYFISKNVQPDLLDFFHRITKDTLVFLKIATIKHRSFLYKRTSESYVGVEIGHDIHEIDLDYTLDNFEDLKSFMQQLLDFANRKSGADLSLGSLFAGDGFQQLCMSSGGVPRDFLSLFVRVANNIFIGRNSPIGKVEVSEEAIASIGTKMDSLKRDSGDDDYVLEEYLSIIKQHVYTNRRTNVFLIAKEDLENHAQSRQAIRELVDLRLIHIVDKNTSCAPSDGRRYEAYIIDIGLYDNSRPRNFTQIEPGSADSKSRKDAIRAAPRIVLQEIENTLKKKGTQLDSLVTTVSSQQ